MVPRIPCPFHQSPLVKTEVMLKVVIEVVCMLVCRIRRLFEKKAMENQEVVEKQEGRPKVETDRVVRPQLRRIIR